MHPNKAKTDSTRTPRRLVGCFVEEKKHRHSLSISDKQPEDNFGWRDAPTETWIWQIDIQIEAIDLGFPVVRLHDTYSQLFQRPFGHTTNKQADKHNTQRLEMGMRAQWGWNNNNKWWRNVWEWMGGSCLCERTVIWKSENMYLSYNTFYGIPCNCRNGFIRLSCIFYLVWTKHSAMMSLQEPIIHSPVGKLIKLTDILKILLVWLGSDFCLISPCGEQTWNKA